VDVGLVNELHGLVVEEEPVRVRADEWDVVAVVGPTPHVDDDGEEGVESVGVVGLVGGVGELELEWEGDAIRELLEALQLLGGSA
jgi:hypothetical protein